MIKVEGLEVCYGETRALWDVSIEVARGEAVAVVGSNGAGKTTLLNAIAGMLTPQKGQVSFDGRPLVGLSPHRIVRSGIAYVPAERELFPQMTVLENLELGAYFNPQGKSSLLKLMFGLFPRLEERKRQLAGTLSGGEQQMLAIARGLMSRPKALLLDEPSTGLAPLLVLEIYRQFRQLREDGLTILLAEQHVPTALSFADRAYVLENGRVRLSGRSKDLLDDPVIKNAYLGVA
ncbi:MAG: ABC transporter ATP-binding protein [Dehalococcoidia bacterium]|nr:ABC transporter ATP-binding protein [Dehalococcoidia bacterium]